MSLIPFLFDYDPWEYRRRRRLWDWDCNWDNFGVGITPDEIRDLMEFPRLRVSSRPKGSDPTGYSVGKDGFQACIDVKQFKPSEITVKTVDNHVVVEGKHEERPDEHGFISRQFVRKYALPRGYDSKEVTSTLSSDGVLTIKAPPPQEAIEAKNERMVQIQQTGPAHLNVKENPANEEEQQQQPPK